MSRDLEFERMWTREAGAAVHVATEELVRFAEQRAGEAPVRDLAIRDFTREGMEEVADARNYLVWRARQALECEEDGEINTLVGRALSAVAVAFVELTRLRDWELGV